MELGISTYTYTWAIGVPHYQSPKDPLSPLRLLELASHLGVGVVQFADNLPLHLLSLEDLKQVRDAAEDYGLEIELGTRGVEPKELLTYLELAEFIEAKIVRTLLHSNTSNPDLEQAYEWLSEVAPEFASSNVAIAIENHDRYTARELAQLIEAVDNPYVGICLDTVNSFGALEGPKWVIDQLGPYVNNLHFKDFDVVREKHQMGFNIYGTPAGSGRLNADWLLDELASYRKDPNLILELWTPFAGNVEATITKESQWAEQSIGFLRKKLAGIRCQS